MKIAFIGQKGLPAKYGGVERHVEELSTRLVQAGHNVVVYSRKWYTEGQDGEYQGVKIKHSPSIHTKHLDTITHVFLATIHALFSGFDVIHYHGIGPSLVSWIPKIFKPQIKIITTFHSLDRKHQKWNFIARTILRLGEWTACNFANQTIAVSQTIKQYCRDVYDKDVIFIPNGVSEYKKESISNLIAQWDLVPKKYVIFLSRLIPHKGAHYLISAWQKIQPTDYKLVIVGDGFYTDNYVKKIKQQASQNSNIIFTGFQNGHLLFQLLSQAKFLVHPSDNEGTPLTVLEGMSYGLPVLLSDIPEHLELIKDQTYLFKHSSIEALTTKLKELLNKDSAELTAVGEKNIALVRTKYNWDNIVPQVEKVYQT